MDAATKRQALLALAIGEWQAALTHVQTLQRVKPGRYQELIERDLDFELERVCSYWPGAQVGPGILVTNREEVIADARAWATEHQDEINTLLTEKEVTHDSTQSAGTNP